MSRYAAFDPRPPPADKLSARCIRRARREDAQALLLITRERDGDAAPAPDGDSGVLARIRGELDGLDHGKPWQVFVAEVAGEVVAYARVRKLDHADSGLPAACPEGWYLTGVVVRPAWRRRGLGALLTRARLEWVWAHARSVHYVTNKQNHVSIALHDRFGFEPVDVDFVYPRAQLEHGEGRLYTRALSRGPGTEDPR